MMRAHPRRLLPSLQAIVLIAALAAALPSAAQPTAPPSISLPGATRVELLGQATRHHLVGVDELYRIALYSDAPLDATRMASEEVSKALRIEVTYERDWQRPPIVAWYLELVPRLDPAAREHLEHTFVGLRRGDIVMIEYAPRDGTSIRVNRTIIVRGGQHDLMLAFLDHWLGQRPVSEEVKRALLGN